VSGRLRTKLRAAIAAAATLTGKRFGLLVASLVVATSAIVAAAATTQPEASPLASLIGHSLAADRTPVPTPIPREPTAEAEPVSTSDGEASEHAPAEETQSVQPVAPQQPVRRHGTAKPIV